MTNTKNKKNNREFFKTVGNKLEILFWHYVQGLSSAIQIRKTTFKTIKSIKLKWTVFQNSPSILTSVKLPNPYQQSLGWTCLRNCIYALLIICIIGPEIFVWILLTLQVVEIEVVIGVVVAVVLAKVAVVVAYTYCLLVNWSSPLRIL